MQIRRAEFNDLEKVSMIEEKCFSKLEACSLEKFKNRYNAFKEYFLVLLNDNSEIIGFILGPSFDDEVIKDEMYENPIHKSDGKYLSVFSIAVLNEYQNKGFGGLLLDSFINLAKENGKSGLILASRESKIKFYENHGFKLISKSQSLHGNTVWFDMVLKF